MSKIEEKDIEEIKRVVEKEFPDDSAFNRFTLQGKSSPKKRKLQD